MQFRVLYRDFLFSVVDRELLSTHARGDASQLLLQIVALLAFLSVCFCLPALSAVTTAPPQARLMFAWSIEHFLIATTMLCAGVFGVLTWNTMFPGQRDVLVLGPLPIRAHTILLAKLAAVATTLGLMIVALHVAAGLVWPVALNRVVPGAGGVRAWIGLLAAYWLTMTMAAVFIFGLIMSAQGIAASLLPRRVFLRVSSLMQLGTFCLVVGVYFLQPMLIRPGVMLAAQQRGFASSPSYWFLGLFQQLSGSPELAPLARAAWVGVGIAVVGTAVAYALSYFRTLQRIAEEPDIAPAVSRVWRLPAFGDRLQTAIVQFSLRTLLRSAQHRVILAFYWGIGFALTIVVLKSPRGQGLAEAGASTWYEAAVPLLVSNILMMVFAVLAARLAFAMPRDLQANWIFRVLPVRGATRYLSARRRALLVVSVAPVWALSAIVFLWLWPWRPAAVHLLALGFLGLILVEIAVLGTQKIPCACSYLPGRSRVHLAVLGVVILLPFVIKAATSERSTLQAPLPSAAMAGALCVVWLGVRWLTATLASVEDTPLEFEAVPAERLVTIELWDSRRHLPFQPPGR